LREKVQIVVLSCGAMENAGTAPPSQQVHPVEGMTVDVDHVVFDDLPLRAPVRHSVSHASASISMAAQAEALLQTQCRPPAPRRISAVGSPSPSSARRR
jgi:hypothetical protein